MKTKLFLIAAAGIVLLAGIARSEEQAPAELSNTRVAIVTLKIVTDPKVVALDDDLSNIINYFTAQRVYGAGNQVLGDSDTEWYEGIEVIDRPKEIGGMQVAKFRWGINLSEQDKPAAREVAQAVIQGLRDYLNREYEENRRMYIAKADVYTRRMQEAEERLQQFIGQQNNLGDGLMDKQTLRHRLAEHEKARIDISMQEAIIKKRAEQLAKNIDQLKAEADGLTAELTQYDVPDAAMIMEMQKRFEAGQILRTKPLSKEEIETMAKTNVAKQMFEKRTEAETKIKERQRQLAEEIARLSRMHRDALMELEELDIRKSVLYGWSPGSLSDSSKYELLEVQIDASKENLKRAIIEKEEYVTQMELLKAPMVIEEILAVPASHRATSEQPNQ